jgi:hypothetical protein
MMYLRRGSAHCEFMRCTFSVMFSIVRSLRTGTEGWGQSEAMVKELGWYG